MIIHSYKAQQINIRPYANPCIFLVYSAIDEDDGVSLAAG
jgi:hypothetical protein